VAPVSRPDEARRARDLLDSGRSRRETARDLAERTGLSRNEAYKLVMELA
jgi:DNA-binding IclR family transcriptional regulator